MRKILLVDIIGRYRRLREIVEQIIGQHLNGQHGEKGHEHAGAQHAEHAAEIRARAHLDIFDDIAEHLAAFDDALLEHQQVLVEQDDVGGLFGDVDRRIDGYADVGSLSAGLSLTPSPRKPTTWPFDAARE